MPTEPITEPITEEVPAFVPYTVEGIGTVEAHEGDTYLVRVPSGALHGYASPSGTPSEELAAEEIAHAIAHPPAFPDPVPASVTRRQLKEQLIRMERLHEVEATVSAIPGTEGRIARNWWAEAVEFRRDHPLVSAIGGTLGLTAAQIDALFVAAAKL